MRLVISLSWFALTLLASPSARGAVMLAGTQNPSPAPGLDSFTISAVSTEGEIINSIAGVNIPSGVHNVTPGFGQPTTHKGHWTAPNGDSRSEWAAYDTHLLFNPNDAAAVVGFIGSIEESNDNTDPAGLNLMGAVLGANEGLGFYRFSFPSDQLVVTPAVASTNLPFLQVVVPEGSALAFSVSLFDTTGARYDLDFIRVPEPGTFVSAAVALVALMATAPRRYLGRSKSN